MNQHVVSRVLLRRFSGVRRSEVGVLDLRSKTSSIGKIAKVGALTDFVVKGADKTEEKWRKVEERLPHAFKLIKEKRILKDPKFLDTIRDCIALHFARSFGLAELYERQRQVKRKQVADNVLARFPATRVVRELTGPEVLPGGAEYIARDLLAPRFDADVEDHGLAAQILLENYERGRDLATSAELEFWYADDELLLGDLPATTFDRNADKVGVLNGVAWGNADALFMPLGPHHAVALSKTAAYLDADARTVEWMNVRQVQGAYREIYFRPGSGLDRLIIDAFSGQMNDVSSKDTP
jgi:hypothetical protein